MWHSLRARIKTLIYIHTIECALKPKKKILTKEKKEMTQFGDALLKKTVITSMYFVSCLNCLDSCNFLLDLTNEKADPGASKSSGGTERLYMIYDMIYLMI